MYRLEQLSLSLEILNRCLKSFLVTIEQQNKSYFACFYVQNNISQLKIIQNIRIRCFERFK
jgi:hypothetical protein